VLAEGLAACGSASSIPTPSAAGSLILGFWLIGKSIYLIVS
jgi:hypothetical protein